MKNDSVKDKFKCLEMVFTFFEGDREKTLTWYNTRNPLFGDLSPFGYAKLKGHKRLLERIKEWIGENFIEVVSKKAVANERPK